MPSFLQHEHPCRTGGRGTSHQFHRKKMQEHSHKYHSEAQLWIPLAGVERVCLLACYNCEPSHRISSKEPPHPLRKRVSQVPPHTHHTRSSSSSTPLIHYHPSPSSYPPLFLPPSLSSQSLSQDNSTSKRPYSHTSKKTRSPHPTTYFQPPKTVIILKPSSESSNGRSNDYSSHESQAIQHKATHQTRKKDAPKLKVVKNPRKPTHSLPMKP